MAGAFGGMGGQSAFGTKAGDLFTKVTIVVAAVWYMPPTFRYAVWGALAGAVVLVLAVTASSRRPFGFGWAPDYYPTLACDFLDEHVRSVLVEEAYREAVDETELRPAGAAQITNVQYAPGERLTFQAEFEIMPSVTLDRLGGFKVEREVAPVTDEEVGEILERIRAEHADWTEVDRGPQDGERVSVAIEPLPGNRNGDAHVRGSRQVLKEERDRDDHAPYTVSHHDGVDPRFLQSITDVYGSIDKSKAQDAGYVLEDGDAWITKEADVLQRLGLQSSSSSKNSFSAPHSGQHQSSGKSSKGVPGGILRL